MGNTAIQTRWKSLVEDLYKSYKETSSKFQGKDPALLNDLFISELPEIDMSAFEYIGIKTLDTYLDVYHHWFFDLFIDGKAFYKYLELAIIVGFPALKILEVITTEYHDTKFMQDICKTETVQPDEYDEIMDIMILIFDFIFTVSKLPTTEQEHALNFLKEKKGKINPLNIEVLESVIEETIVPIKNFYFIIQGKAINLLPTAKTKNLTPDFIDVEGNALSAQDDFSLMIKNYETLKNGIPDYVYQFFDCLLWQFTLTGARTAQIRLPLADYMNMRGLKDIKEARKGVLDSIEILKLIEFDVLEGVKGKTPRWSGNISIYGGTGYIKNSVIYFNFNQDFYDRLCLYREMYRPMEISKQALYLNTHKNPNSFHFLKYICFNYRMNEGRNRQDIISIETLIKKSPSLPTYDEVSNSNRAFNQRIVQPTFRDLDILELVNYTVFSIDDKDITNMKYELSYEDFITSKIKIDYALFQPHPARLESRRQYIETAQKRKRQPRKKFK